MKLMRLTPFLLFALASADASFAEVRSFPAGPWGSVEVNVPAGWTAKVETQKAKGGPSIQIAPGRGVPLVLLLTPLPGPGDADETTRSPRQIVEDVIRGSLQKIAVEDALPVRDGIWVDVHLSKIGFQESDAGLFDKILASVRFEQ